MIQSHFWVTLVVSTGQTHNFGKTAHSVITHVPSIDSTHQTFLPKSSPLVYVCNFVCTAVSPCQGLSVIFSVVNDLYDIYIYICIASLR